ncbi:MAG: inositol monophosphatase family protein [Candidatus Hodarchaeota archaeon]
MPAALFEPVQRFWMRHLQNAAALARLRVLSCLKTRNNRDIIGTGAGGDTTRQFDFVAEQTMVNYLRQYSSFTLISEEAGIQQIGTDPSGFVIMDPIDGSTNVSHGISVACIALAFARKAHFESIEVAVIQDLFSRNVYHAMKGKGAWKNYQPIHAPVEDHLEPHLIGVDDEFPSLHYASEKNRPSESRIQFTRHFGANALELCFVADGSIDGFIDLRKVFRGTDLAAPALILREAGAALIDETGKVLTGRCTNDEKYALVAAWNEQMAKRLLDLAHGTTS